MKVYIRGLEKTSTIYLYGSGDDEVTEQFIAKLGSVYKECEPMNDELRATIDTDIDLSDVKYVMSEKVFIKFASTFERLQEIYDKIADTAYKHNMSPDELCDYLSDRGIISRDEINTFMCY